MTTTQAYQNFIIKINENATTDNLSCDKGRFVVLFLKFLEFSLVDGDNQNKVSAPLKNTKGSYTDEVKAILSALDGANISEEVTFTVKTSTKKDPGTTG